MKIQVTELTAPQTVSRGSKSYQTVTVKYLAGGKAMEKKVVSFDPIYKDVMALKEGQEVEVTSVKEGDFWKWTEIKSVSSTPATGEVRQKSSFESKEDRDARQLYIIRQSSLSNAINTLKTEKHIPSTEDVISLAAVYADWVFSGEIMQEKTIANLEEDIPL